MPVIGVGVREIRVRVGADYRVVFLANLPEAVYVLHVFEKRSQATAGHDLRLARHRMRLLLQQRGHR